MTFPRLGLAIAPPLPPSEAESVGALPSGPGWQFEPKWDGFRCLAFRDRHTLVLQSKAGRPLDRYFPELVAALHALDADRFVLDGEIVIPARRGFDFDALLQRIHPAERRIRKLAAETPARLLVFDLLVDAAGTSWVERPLIERRRALERFALETLPRRNASAMIQLSPATTDRAAAQRLVARIGGVDGIVAKRLDCPYLSGERTGMKKWKWRHTADCVIGGFRYDVARKEIGFLLLGLYDGGLLHYIGDCSSLSAELRRRLKPELEALASAASGFTGHAPVEPDRSQRKGTGDWVAVEPRLVVEVEWKQAGGDHARRGARFVRLRPDKSPSLCGMDQISESQRNESLDAHPEG